MKPGEYKGDIKFRSSSFRNGARYTFLLHSLLSQSTKESGSQVCSIQTIFIFCRNYPSWLFVESANNSSSDEADLDPDRECGDSAEIVVVECPVSVRHPDPGQDDSDSEDEGWYSLSRTDVRKLQGARSAGERCDVNIILTNPDIDILHLCAEEDEEEDEENERKQESSPERTSYR